MPGTLSFEFTFSQPKQEPALRENQPMRILILGDFSGRAQCAQEDTTNFSTRRIYNIDIDDLEQVLERMAINIRLSINDMATDIAIRELEDFHPDQLYQSLEIFKAMESTRNQPETSETTFAELLGGQVKHAPNKSQSDSASQNHLDTMIKKIVGDLPIAALERDEHKAAVDAVSEEIMRKLLHNPAFSTIEAAWRSLHLLVTSLELDENLQLHIVDISKQEIRDDLVAAGSHLEATSLHQLLVEQARQSPDSVPWSVIIGNYTFDTSEDDVMMLAALGAIGEQAGAPFIAAASPRLLGCETLADNGDPSNWTLLDDADTERWQALRESVHAPWIGLAAPRLLLRQPYGKNSDPIEHFNFEEIPGLPSHEDYLWGNPAFGCALLLGHAFTENGWSMSPNDVVDISDLPAHTWRLEGETHMQACAEVYLSERAGDAILEKGIMPFLSFKNRNAVRLLRSQSIAFPPRALSGPW